MEINRLLQVLKNTFPIVEIDSSKILTVGSFPEWDSLGHFTFLMAVEGEFGIQFSTEEISELKSLVQIESVLMEKGIML